MSSAIALWHKACVIASRALDLRGDGGTSPARLRFSDVTMVVDAFKLACNDQGELYAPSHQGRMLRQFFDLLDFARREGIAGDLSPRFVRHPGHHSIKWVDRPGQPLPAQPGSAVRGQPLAIAGPQHRPGRNDRPADRNRRVNRARHLTLRTQKPVMTRKDAARRTRMLAARSGQRRRRHPRPPHHFRQHLDVHASQLAACIHNNPSGSTS